MYIACHYHLTDNKLSDCSVIVFCYIVYLWANSSAFYCECYWNWFKNKQQFQNLLVYIWNNIIIITVFVDLPPPPPEAFDQLEDSNEKHNMQSRSFKVLQDAVEHGGKYIEYSQKWDTTDSSHCLTPLSSAPFAVFY